MLTPTFDDPLELEDIAPPIAWRIKLMMSQGMKV
jgi:hypothetical protein